MKKPPETLKAPPAPLPTLAMFAAAAAFAGVGFFWTFTRAQTAAATQSATTTAQSATTTAQSATSTPAVSKDEAIQELEDDVSQLQDQSEQTRRRLKIDELQLTMMRDLRLGSSGDDVKRLQAWLAGFAELSPPHKITGYYNVATEKTIKRFQKQQGLPATGVFDAKTRSKLSEIAITAGKDFVDSALSGVDQSIQQLFEALDITLPVVSATGTTSADSTTSTASATETSAVDKAPCNVDESGNGADTSADQTPASVCGDGICDKANGENYLNCPQDCIGPYCGDGHCDPNENHQNCPRDCPDVCGDGVCDAGETHLNCPKDCPASCGDGKCDNGETHITCPRDCP